jgi:PilZ domain
MSECRKCPRFTDTSLVTFSSDEVSGGGQLDNLSDGGAAITSAIAVSQGDYLTLTITFLDPFGQVDVELAPVRWVRGEGFGVEFIKMSHDSKARLTQYLHNLQETSATRP